MSLVFTRLVSLVLSLFFLVGTLAAQTYSPYTLEGSAKGAKKQILTVREAVVLPKGKASFRLAVPAPTGETSVLELREASVFSPEMQARYPEIRTYRGFDVATGQIAAITQTSRGINAYVMSEAGSWQIEADGAGEALLSYVNDEDSSLPTPTCGYSPADDVAAALELAAFAGGKSKVAAGAKAPVQKRKYILALACTGEFGQRYGGTIASVNEAFAESLNILNAITVREVAVEFELHPDNDLLIFLNAGTDPYLAADNGGNMLDENEAAINSRIPPDQYDIGHVFTNGCSGGVGGIAAGRACATSKARGVTCHYAGLRRIVENVMAHEFAHQFSVSHTWNNCPTADDQRAGGSAFEPGSGSTIMSYQGSCGVNNNVSPKGDNIYYHVRSIEQFVNFLQGPLGSSCAEVIPVANELPEVTAPGINGLTIPGRTPFVLRGSATDADDEVLLYTWEQYDLGAAVDLCEQRDETPLFRSLSPSTRGNVRYLPDLNTVLAGSRNDCEEQLPRFSRDLTFRLTARDRKVVGGGTTWAEVGLKVDATAGPFLVTSQASAATQYASSDFVTVTWDVAGTNAGTINAQNVEILLSTNGGQTFPTVLSASTPNDGTEGVLLPGIETVNARIMVRPIGNIFYAVSPATFKIITPTVPGFSFAPSAETTFICAADTASIELFTGSLLNYDKPISLSVTGDLPDGVNVELSRTTLQPGEKARLLADFSAFDETTVVTVTVVATAEGAETATRTITFDRVSDNFSDLRLGGPANSESGLSGLPTFSFTPSRRATDYVVQVNPDPNFGPGTFEITEPDPTGDQLGFLLEPNTVYFWRVVPRTRCGEYLDVPINAFHTFAAECLEFKNESGFGIPGNSTTPVVVTVPVTASGDVSDINVPLVNIRFGGGVNNLVVSLISPDATEVRLYNRRCGGGLLVSGYDDEAPLENNCDPLPIDGRLRKPNRPLSAFNGKEIQGDWKLKLDPLVASPAGGEFIAFNLEFCANITSASPTFQSNEVPVPQGGFQYLLTEYLNAADPDNGPDDLEYIIVAEPKRGHIELNGRRLEKGSRFNQAQVQSAQVTYVDDANTIGVDSMRIVLTDNAGGIVATPRIDFMIDPNNVTGVEESASVGMTLAPNPAGSWSRLRFTTPSEGGQLTILDAQGRRIHTQRVNVGQSEIDIDAAAYPVGIYLVDYRGAEGVRTMRLVRQ